MDSMTQQNSALVEENAASVKTLEELSVDMDGKVSVFKTATMEARPVRQPKSVPAPRPVASKTPAASKPAAIVRGPARRMQAQLAAAVAKDDDWDEF
jgi:methyl-accepting chemotaxis protein